MKPSSDSHAEDPSAGGQAPPESDIELANRLMRFYNADSLYALIRIQNRHVERLQEKVPRPSLGFDPVNRVREG